ncbi:MAG: methyl-accepting chemotaxis protein [Melioribacteraceae bacterium]|nr:methyl-accepting chemotaxis protein [Melioribacteraceae bacterium]MCF8354001.1 methyl-accepting chemotaxis protein [Melioribacteraceae bacterium]MCF8392318.1 methyl-accepting chemotaxis protein [Melioribacteraceae bacterium]MCF8417650.1 methyl-accepting chemotaxis protein [Melioribacteraceae bacterium]
MTIQKYLPRKIRSKLFVYAGLTFLIIVSFVVGIYIYQMHSNLLEDNEEKLLKNVENLALKIQKKNLDAVTVSRILSKTQRHYYYGKIESTIENGINVLERNKELTAVFFAFEDNSKFPNYIGKYFSAFNSKGEFAPHISRTENIHSSKSITALKDVKSEVFYEIAKENFQKRKAEEYFISRVENNEQNITIRYSYPIIIDSTFIGVCGVERKLPEFESMFDRFQSFKAEGYILVDNLGFVINSSMDTGMRSKNISDVVYSNILTDFFSKDYSSWILSSDPVDGEEYYYAESKVETGNWTLVLRIAEEEILAQVQKHINIAIFLSFIGIIFALFIFINITNSIIKPLQKAISAAAEISEGNLLTEIKVTSFDESGRLLRGIHRMKSNLAHLVDRIDSAVLKVKSIANKIELNAGNQQKRVRRFNEFTSDIGVANNQISATSKNLMQSMNKVFESASSTSDKAKHGHDSISEMENKMSQLVKATREISNKLQNLHDKSVQITSIITTINKIADQTNLLSLNAAIEAEKAGDYGDGFSVVASEIRRLSDQTTNSIVDIEEIILEMKNAVGGGVKEINKFSEEVSFTVNEVNEISSQLGSIIKGFSGIVPQFNNILEGMDSQVLGTQHIKESISELNEKSKSSLSIIDNFSASIERLNDTVSVMQKQIQKFKIR